MLKLFKHFSSKEKGYILFSILFIVIQVWLDLKLPDYMSNITTLIQTEGNHLTEILVQGGYMLLCTILSMGASMVVGYFAAVVASGIAKTLRGEVYDKTLSFSQEEINQFSTASLINRTTNDITQIQSIVSMGLQAIIKGPILAVWAVLKIMNKSWQWSIATTVAVLILVILLAVILIVAVPRFKKVQTLTDKLNVIVREQLGGIRVVRAYNAEEYQEEKFAQVNTELTSTNLTVNRMMAIMSPSMTLINSGLTLAVYWIGAYLINAASIGNKLTIFSDMVVFSNYAMQVIMAFMLLNMIFILLPRAQVSAQRINEILDTTVSIQDGVGHLEKEIEDGVLEFENVYFKYPDGGDYVLEQIDFKVRRGETIAFIGATGSGKSTLVNLIPRFYDVSSGEVKVNGVNVKEYKLEELNNLLGYVSQKAVLFSGTISSNIAYGENGKSTIDFETIEEAVEIAQSKDFVEKLEDTYDGYVAEGGTNLSGGQKQRISIARAIARDPEIFIFDDTFSALDYKTDAALREALEIKTKNAITLIVAQRIGTIKNADQIVVLDHGKIAGKGTHDELMETCEVYQEIALSQLSKEELAYE